MSMCPLHFQLVQRWWSWSVDAPAWRSRGAGHAHFGRVESPYAGFGHRRGAVNQKVEIVDVSATSIRSTNTRDRSPPSVVVVDDDGHRGAAAITRTRILQAAVDEFAAHGYAGARVERIGQMAGANEQLLYNYFGGKDGLYRTVLGTFQTAVDDVRTSAPAEFAGRVAALTLAMTSDELAPLIRISQ
jgi:hypothetical protein